LRPGLGEGGADAGALRLRQALLQLTAAFGQFEETLAAVLGAAMLNDEALPYQLPQHAVEALFGDAQYPQQLADRHLGVPSDEMHDPVMGAAETVMLEDRVGLGGEVAVG